MRLAPSKPFDAEDLRHRHADYPRRFHAEPACVRQVGEPARQVRVEIREHRRHPVDERSSQEQGFGGPEVGHAGTFAEWSFAF